MKSNRRVSSKLQLIQVSSETLQLPIHISPNSKIKSASQTKSLKQSKIMASSSSSNQHYRPKNRGQTQYQYVPKSTNKINTTTTNKTIPSLTTSLRSTALSSSSVTSSSKEMSNFVNYLPQDEAVASGLGVDAGGLDAVESQRVVDLLNDELSKILKMNIRDFWKEVAKNDCLHEFLDSYLQFRHRWYDFPHHGAKGIVAGVIVGETELCRRVFMVLYRMSSNRDPGTSKSECLSMKDHTVLLQEKRILDLPKLLDICAIYGHENGELTRSLVTNVFKAQPKLLDSLSATVSHFLSIVHKMHQRCSTSLEALVSSVSYEDHNHALLYKDFLEVMDFINDAVVTLDAFADSFEPAALHFSISFDMSYGSDDLLNTLSRLHDALLPSLQQGLTLISTAKNNACKSDDEVQIITTNFKMLSKRIVSLGWKLLDICYLRDEPIEDSLLESTAKMFPFKVEDPGIRGDIIIQIFKEINAQAIHQIEGNTSCGTFVQNLEKNHKALNRIGTLRDRGWIFIDENQFQYLAQIARSSASSMWESVPESVMTSQDVNTHTDEESIIMESKISQIKDLFPDYGKGFLTACLDVYNHDPEEVIQRILEGTLHGDLQSLDTSLEKILPPKSSSTTSSNKNDKGKGLLIEESPNWSDKGKRVLVEELPNQSTSSALPAIENLTISTKDTKAPPPPSSLSTYGRFIRKPDALSSFADTLDLKSAKNEVRAAVLAAELEYDDEYDDSFDDLGLSVVESGVEITDSLGENANFKSSNSGSSSSSKWASRNKPQFYVKDGKNYSYKVSGSVAVFDAQEAALYTQTQKEMIHGLGRGGNVPQRPVRNEMIIEEKSEDLNKKDSEGNGENNRGRGNMSSRGRGGRRGRGRQSHSTSKENEMEKEESNEDNAENRGGRGNVNSRGGRRGGGRRNSYRKDRAMMKHFSGLTGT